jgi:hypothetical protein
MAVDVILVLITLVTAVIGTLSNPPRWVKVAIITLAASASCASIIKSYLDERDKDFVKTALINSLNPSSTKSAIFGDQAADALRDDYCNSIEYRRINDGMGIFCYDIKLDNKGKRRRPTPEDPFTKVLILTTNNLSTMFSNDLKEGGILETVREEATLILGRNPWLLHKENNANVRLVKEIAQRRYDDDDDDQPARISEQIGILGEATFRLISGFNASGFYNDDTRGVRTYFNVKGHEGELVVKANEIDTLPNVVEVKILTEIGNRFRKEIIDLGIK